MTDTLNFLINIFTGIVGANLMGFVFKKYSFGIVGNTIAGVFGSVFFIKVFARLGLDPVTIMETGQPNYILFVTNISVSFLGGALALFFAYKIQVIMNKKT